MIAWPAEIVDAIARRRSVIFIGSGVSRNSTNEQDRRPATWEQFLRTAATELGDPPSLVRLIDKEDYLTACEIIKKRLTPDKFNQRVQLEYQRPGYKPADIHRHIYDLDSSIVATPNFDNIYDTYATNTSHGSVVIKSHSDFDIVNYIGGGDHRLIIRTHGTANSPANVIFTRNEYANARTQHRLFYEMMKALVITHRFLFLGCGINDPDIRLLFEDLRFAYSQLPTHYMTAPNEEVDADIMEIARETMKVECLTYDPANGHAELTASLADLVAQVDARREALAPDQTW